MMILRERGSARAREEEEEECKQTAPTARSGPLSVSLIVRTYLLLLARARAIVINIFAYTLSRLVLAGFVPHQVGFLSCYSKELAIFLALWCKRRQPAVLALVRHILALASVLYTRASWLDSPSQPVSDKNSGIHARCFRDI
jgi:hypothetical protein